jgi:hypothetical protein
MGAIIIDFATKKMDLKNQTQAQNLTEDQASEIIVAITQQEGIYAEAEEKIKNVLVPSSYADIHLAILNSFNRIVVASIEAEKVNDDPVKALANVKIIKDEMPVWGANLSDLATKLISDNISFNNDEPGGAIIMFQQALQQ